MKKIIFLLIVLSFALIGIKAENICPEKTTPGKNNIFFVGRLDGLGGDQFVKTWFEYGESKENLNQKTRELTLTQPGIFCFQVDNLVSCKTYFYRAAAQNQAGVNYGEMKSIQTLCSTHDSVENCQPDTLKPVKYGQKGNAVKNLQACLIQIGYKIPAGITGYYGTQTQKAVKQFYADWYGNWHGKSFGPKGIAELKLRLSKKSSVKVDSSKKNINQAQWLIF